MIWNSGTGLGHSDNSIRRCMDLVVEVRFESQGNWRDRVLEGTLIYLSPTVLTAYHFGLSIIECEQSVSYDSYPSRMTPTMVTYMSMKLWGAESMSIWGCGVKNRKGSSRAKRVQPI